MATKYLILGAGMSGLGAAYYLGEDAEVYEREGEVGGLCRSKRVGDFTLDRVGHVLHFSDSEIEHLLLELTGEVRHVSRVSRICVDGEYIDYPFQANFCDLPQKIARECLEGYRLACATSNSKQPKNFFEWIQVTFGDGIARHFMIPYNEKFWPVRLDGMSWEWAEELVPVPALEEVEENLRSRNKRRHGYNADFWYPVNGGIGIPAKKLAEAGGKVHLEHEAISVNAADRSVRFANGTEEHYDHLISTIPLPQLFEMTDGLEGSLKDRSRELVCSSLVRVALGVERPQVSDAHWAYVPSIEFAFHRVGFPSNLSESVAPEGTSIVTAEITCSPQTRPDADETAERTISDLRRMGVLRPGDKILCRDVEWVEFAYPVHCIGSDQIVAGLKGELEKHGIHSIGRFGSWRHAGICAAMAEARTLAAELQSLLGEVACKAAPENT